MKAESRYIVLETGKHYTPAGFVNLLNNKYGNKKSGKKFHIIDIVKYLDRGHLPVYLGSNSLKKVDIPKMGISLIEIGDPVKRKKRKTFKLYDNR